MAKSAARRRGRAQRSRKRRGSAGFRRTWLVAGLLVLCAGALAWYFRDALDLSMNGTPRSAAPVASARSERAAKGPIRKLPAPEATKRFEFYDMLEDAEVNVPLQTDPVRPAAPPPISRPGVYVIQAGAFPDFADADKVKARLALLGVASLIQTAQANGSVFHRVRIGPIENLNEINQLRTRLRQNGIEYQVIPVGE